MPLQHVSQGSDKCLILFQQKTNKGGDGLFRNTGLVVDPARSQSQHLKSGRTSTSW